MNLNITNRVTPIWNNLCNSVLTVDSSNSFKSRLDKFWSLHDFVYDYRAQPLPEVQETKFSYSSSY